MSEDKVSNLNLESTCKEQCADHVTPCFNSLPIELIIRIFAGVGGISLKNCILVCRKWSDAIKILESSTSFWYNCCLKEIPKRILSEIVDLYVSNGYYTYIVGRNTVEREIYSCWKRVYNHFLRSFYIQKCKQKTTAKIELKFRTVTAINICGNTLFVGFTDGEVLGYSNLIASEEHAAVLIHRGTASVADLASFTFPVSTKRSIIAVISIDHSTGIFLSNIAVDRGGLLQAPLYFSVINIHSKPIESISYRDNYFITASSDVVTRGQPLWRMVQDGWIVQPEYVCTLSGHTGFYVSSTCLCREQVVSNVEKSLLVWRFADERISEDAANIEPKVIDFLDDIVDLLICDGDICIGVSVHTDTLCVLNTGSGETFQHQIFASLYLITERIALSGQIFVVGTVGAFIFLYLVKGEDWAGLNLKEYDQKIKVDGEHIRGIHIADRGSGPVIVVASDKAITILHWHAGISSEEKKGSINGS